jgi:hypothetical protein
MQNTSTPLDINIVYEGIRVMLRGARELQETLLKESDPLSEVTMAYANLKKFLEKIKPTIDEYDEFIRMYTIHFGVVMTEAMTQNYYEHVIELRHIIWKYLLNPTAPQERLADFLVWKRGKEILAQTQNVLQEADNKEQDFLQSHKDPNKKQDLISILDNAINMTDMHEEEIKTYMTIIGKDKTMRKYMEIYFSLQTLIKKYKPRAHVLNKQD